jgi:hypothetical protein
MTDELVPVRMSDCRCPGSPHPDGDIAYLRPYLLFEGGMEALRAMSRADGDVSLFGTLVGPVYIRHGVVSWNRLDDAGEPVPVTPEALAALRYEDAYELADRADDLYGESVIAPLARRIAKSSAGGRTGASTSANSRSRSKRPRPSQPS